MMIEDESDGAEDITLRLLEERIIFFGDVIFDESVNEFENKLKFLSNKSNDTITIYINSPGGTVSAGMKLINLLERSKVSISTLNMGMCSGMAAFVLLSGSKGKRFCMAGSHVILNPLSRKINDEIAMVDYEGERHLISLLKKRTKISEAEYKRFTEYEMKIDPFSQVKYGIVDGVCGKSAKTGQLVYNMKEDPAKIPTAWTRSGQISRRGLWEIVRNLIFG